MPLYDPIWSSDPVENKRVHTVIIDVRGGVAEVAAAPNWLDVIIRDYDNCEAGSDADYCTEDQ